MSCIDAACYKKKYATVFLLLKSGITTAKVRERHEYFAKAYPKDNIQMIDERIEQIMAFFDKYLPRLENFDLVRQLQTSHAAVTPRHPELAKYDTLLKDMVTKDYESVLVKYVAS